MKLVLSETDIKTRIRGNVIDLVGHSLTIVIKLVWVVIGMMGTHWMPSNVAEFPLRCFTMSLYGLLSAFHLGFSRPLRTTLKSFSQVFSSSHQQNSNHP